MNTRSFFASREALLGAVFVVLFVAPIIALGGNKTIFVDKDNKGSEDGSHSHPYRTIDKALDKAKKGTEVRVMNGTYKENITIPKDVKLVSDSEKRDKVIIKADHSDEPVVTMKDDSKLSHVTVKDGNHGIRVMEDAKVHVFNVVIKDNKRDGIRMGSAPTDKKHRALIDQVLIKDNGRAGIFSHKRFTVLIDSTIGDNKSDGIDFAAGTEAWLEDNKITGNGGSGAKFVLDKSEIWTKDNSFRGNKREGIEINSYGVPGKIGFKKATIKDNGRHGIAQVARTAAALRSFKDVFTEEGVNANKIQENVLGSVTGVLRGF